MHLESLSNGLGAPSLLLLVMAIRGEIPATVSITADTGWENDRLWNTGERTTSEEYFNRVIVPLCKGSHVTPYFVRSVDKNKQPLKPLRELLIEKARNGEAFGVPLFGSRGGRARQSCTDKMKIRAIHQRERMMGAKSARNAQGIHFHEADRRTKGRFLRMDGQWSEYQTTVAYTVALPDGSKVKKHKDIKWQKHYYPLVDLRLGREDVYDAIKKEGIPYLISSECDGCPHQDLDRWERKSQATIDDVAWIESLFKGQYFFTDRRIPLKEAIAAMQADRIVGADHGQVELDFGCGNAICGV